MFASLALAIAASASPGAPLSVAPAIQARAMVRIVSGVRLRLDGRHRVGVPKPRNSTISANGEQQAAKLIEFE
jgi:hypothetical protein